MLVCFGDLHLSDDREWSTDVSNRVVDFITNHELNTSENIGVFLGDLTEQATLYGTAYDFLFRLFSGLKFSRTYIVVGNHDIKLNKSKQLSLTYKFLQSKHSSFKNIEVVDKLKEETIDGKQVLFLPFVYKDGVQSIADYESLPKEISEKQYDIIFGHFANTSETSYPGTLTDVSYLKTQYWCFGHVHTPSKQYIGSIIPNTTAEAGCDRFLRTYSSKVTPFKETLIPIPKILEYNTIEYPQPLGPTDSEVTVYTVNNCVDESVAKLHYGDIYIKKCSFDISLDREELDTSGAFKSTIKLTTKDLFAEYRQTSSLDSVILDRAEKYLAGLEV